MRGTNIMNFKTILLASAVALAAPAAAFAGDVAYNVALTSDYVFRGVSQTDEGAALSAGVDVTAGGWYFGAWASNVDGDFIGSDDLEYDIYGGYKHSFGPITIDVGALSYNYLNFIAAVDGGITEFKLGATAALPANISAGVTYYTNTGTFGYDYVEFGASAPLGDLKIGPFGLALAGTYGTMNTELGNDYDNWKIALSGTTESGWVVEAAYTDTDDDGELLYGDLATERGVLTIKKNF